MPQLGRAAAVAVLSAIAFHLLGFGPLAGPAVPALTLGTVLVLIALSTAIDLTRNDDHHSVVMRVSFIGEVATLLLLGAFPMTVVSVIDAAARLVIAPPRTRRARAVLLTLLAAAAASQSAGATYELVARLGTPVAWPWQALPLGAAVFAYCAALGSFEDLVVPRVHGVAASRRWPSDSLRGLPSHVVGASIAAGLIEILRNEAWTIVPVVAVPLYFVWSAYESEAQGDAGEAHATDVRVDEQQAACRVDRSGRVVSWSPAMEALLDCPASRARGRWLNVGVPALGTTSLPRAVQDTLGTRSTRVLPPLPVKVHGRAKTIQTTIVADADGATVLCVEVGEAAAGEQAIQESAGAFELAGRGATDGLWILDLSTGQLHVSARWRHIVGIDTAAERVSYEDWLSRIASEDRTAVKGIIEDLVSGRVPHVDHEHCISRDDGTRRVRMHCVAERQGDRRASRIGGSLADVTDAATALQQAEDASRVDALTGLLTRAAFVARVEERLARIRIEPGGRFAVILLDLDRFKVVNDSLGHVVGDHLLGEVAARLQTALRLGDVLARLSGDEFAVLLDTVGDEMQANVVGFRLQEALKPPFSMNERDVVISASIGIAMSRPDYANAEELLRDSDTAMYHAKSRGKARHELFDVDMHARANDRLGLESDLRDAVNTAGFEVHYQPIVSLSTRRCIGFESLVRWNRNGKAVSPADFVPMAEELGIIEPIGTWVMQQACRQFAEWKARYRVNGPEFITVNVSARQLVQQGFAYLVERTVEQNRMEPADLRIEITETALMDAPQVAADVLSELREYGVKIYLDDFGTGYSSLSHLHKLPVDALKIDRSFVRGLLTPDRPAIVESILALARTLNTNVVAEGIEDERQAIELERLGCRHAQGFYFSRPIPADQVEELLASNRTLGAMRVPARAAALKEVKREIA